MECKICMSSEVGLHYKITSCRACAAFFRRTIQRKLRYKCTREENCDVTYDNRFSCRYCRMTKCVKEGMIMSDEASTSFDFYIDKNCNVMVTGYESEDEFYNSDNILNDPVKFRSVMQQRIRDIFQSKPNNRTLAYSLCQQFSDARAIHAAKWPKCSPETIYPCDMLDMNKYFGCFYKTIECAAEFCMEIGHFRELPEDEKHLVFQHFAERFVKLDRLYATVELLGNDLNDSRMVSVFGQILDFNRCSVDLSKLSNWSEDQLRSLFLDSTRRIETELKRPFKRLKADEFEKDFLLGYCMWSIRDVPGISRTTVLESERICDRFTEELNMYYKYEKRGVHCSERIYKIFNILTGLKRMTELMKENNCVSKTFQLLNFELYVDDIFRQ